MVRPLYVPYCPTTNAKWGQFDYEIEFEFEQAFSVLLRCVYDMFSPILNSLIKNSKTNSMLIFQPIVKSVGNLINPRQNDGLKISREISGCVF